MLKSLFEQIGLALFGLVTTALVVLANVLLRHLTGYNFASFSINFIPVGAIGAGALAASGYYFGAVYTHNRANTSLLVLMTIVAGLAQIFIYWYDYATAEGNLKDIVSFSEYLSYVINHVHLQVVGRRVGYHDFRDVGGLGSILALTHFIGFLIGGVSIFALLRSKLVCSTCNLYLSELKIGVSQFSNAEAVVEYMNTFAAQSVDAYSVPNLLKHNVEVSKVEEGSFQVQSIVLGCPICPYKVIKFEFSVFADNKWKHLEESAVSMEFVPTNIGKSLPASQPVDSVGLRDNGAEDQGSLPVSPNKQMGSAPTDKN